MQLKPHQPPSLCQYDIIFTIFPNPTFPETLFSHPLHLSCLFCQGCSPSKTNSSASALECLWKPGTVISLDNTPASAWSVIYIIDHKSQKEKPPLSRVAGPCWIGSQEQLRGSPPEGPPRWGQGGSPSRSNKGSPHPRSPRWGWGGISSPRTPGWYSEEATAPRSWLCGLVGDCGSQELERRRWVLLGFVARIAGFRPDSPSRAGCKPRGHRKTLGSYTRPLAMPAQPAGDQPGLAGQGECGPGSQDLYAITEAFSLLEQEDIPLQRTDYKANCSCPSSKASEVRKLHCPSPKSLKMQAGLSALDILV